MHPRLLAATLSLLLSACGGTTVEGKVVDGMTGEPIGGYKIVAKATSEDASLTCQFKEAEVAEDGTFKLLDLCGGTPYHLEPDREDVWLAEVNEVPDGGFGGPTELKAWRAPKGPGLYKLSGGEIEPLQTAADVKREQIRGTETKVRYPSTVPNKVPLVAPGDHLVLVGKGTIEETKLFPLIKSGERVFGDAGTKVTMQPWVYVGVEFQDDKTFEEVEAEIDSSKFLEKSKDSRMARWIPGSAVKEGRYAALKEGDRRMYILDFGASQSTDKPVAEE